MRKKSKRTKGIEQAHPFDGLSRVNPHAAGVDIGADEIVVCVSANESTQRVRGFGNYTVDLHAIADWLKEHKVKTVAMESTSVSWIPLSVWGAVPTPESTAWPLPGNRGHGPCDCAHGVPYVKIPD